MTATECMVGTAGVLEQFRERIQKEILEPCLEKVVAAIQAPLAKFEHLAAAYLAETGRLAPDAQSDAEAWDHWRTWLTRHTDDAPTKPKRPKGQLSLL